MFLSFNFSPSTDTLCSVGGITKRRVTFKLLPQVELRRLTSSEVLLQVAKASVIWSRLQSENELEKSYGVTEFIDQVQEGG